MAQVILDISERRKKYHLKSLKVREPNPKTNVVIPSNMCEVYRGVTASLQLPLIVGKHQFSEGWVCHRQSFSNTRSGSEAKN